MKAAELRTKSVDELQTLLGETKTTLLENKRALAAGELPNPRVVGKTRRDIARIQTLIREKKVTKSSKGEA